MELKSYNNEKAELDIRSGGKILIQCKVGHIYIDASSKSIKIYYTHPTSELISVEAHHSVNNGLNPENELIDDMELHAFARQCDEFSFNVKYPVD